jgi:hypothetical protein
MSISAIEEKYNTFLLELKNKQATEVLSLLIEIFKIENFTKSKEVVFLHNRSKNKLKALQILNAFDSLRYNYDSSNMQRIQCNNFTITEDLILETSCVAFSNNFENDIR